MGHYLSVTELPGQRGSREQVERLLQRYGFAFEFCANRDVLEVACGAGIGLGLLGKNAKKVVGGDIDESVLSYAKRNCEGRKEIGTGRLDGHCLPFRDKTFDVVVLYEAIYYLRRPDLFLDDCRRVLRDDGVVLICTVNKEWADFNPSPYSTRYFSASELHQLLKEKFSNVDLYGGFVVSNGSFRSKITSIIKRTAIAFDSMPKTMKGKELLKRIFFGRLITLPSKIEEGMSRYVPPTPISHDLPNQTYKVIYAVAYCLHV